MDREVGLTICQVNQSNSGRGRFAKRRTDAYIRGMTDDIADRLAAMRHSGGAFALLKAEMAGESASSLGHHGRQVEAAMNAIRAFDATGTGTGQQREALVKTAARAVWHYFVQRELCGMRDHRWVINDYGITNEVMARLGAIER